MAYLRAKDTVNGALGTCYARIDGERHELMQVKNVTATVKKTRTEIPILGLTGKQHKSGGNTLEKQPTQRPAKETAKTYVVKKGDNLWNIAKKELGDGSKFGELAKKNGISNPSLIYPGQVIKL